MLPVYGGQPIVLQSAGPGARRGRGGGHAREGRSTISPAAPSTSPASARWSWTKPTRCWTWASPTTWRPSCGPYPTSGRRCSSRPRSRPASRPGPRPSPRSGAHPYPERAAGGRRGTGGPAQRLPGPRQHKPAALGRVLDVEAPESALIFCRTRVEVDELTERSQQPRLPARRRCTADEPAAAGPGDGPARERVGRLIVATDVAARGLDIGPSDARGQLRRALFTGGLHPPHRPGGAGGADGGGHHPASSRASTTC